MKDFTIKIGILPTRRETPNRPMPAGAKPGFLNAGVAGERAKAAIAYVKKNYASENVSFVDLEGINEEGLLFTDKDVEKAVERFQKEKVDALFVINTNFGNEEVVAETAYQIGKPVLLWGPRDEHPDKDDGTRITDSQCGLFAVSRQLQRRNVKFTYIENCKIEAPVFDKGMRNFFSVVCMVKNFKKMRLGQIGSRPKPFCSVIYNESELLSKFNITVIPINISVVIQRYNEIMENRKDELAKGAELFKSQYEMDELSPPLLEKVYAFVLLYEDLIKDFNLDLISSECWSAMMGAVGAMPCGAFSILADKGHVVGCETDTMGSITMFLLECASLGKSRSFFGEFTIRHPNNDNAELLWHCGPFAHSLKKEGSHSNFRMTRPSFEVKAGKYTVGRLDQLNGDYMFLAGTAKSVDGPYTNGTYLWAEFEDLPAWERKLIEGPYIHHVAEIEGDYMDAIREFCKYIPYLEMDEVK